MNQSFIWANLIWSAVASGYIIYGWRQKSYIPLFGGVAITAVSWLTPALTMTLLSIAIMVIVWWLLKQGY